jgi:protein-L-isoaspartate O-methyltransferase
LAHSDQPLKEDNIHISAPHIYGTIVESLDLEPGSSQSFLNIGSGTGYLSCIVSQVLGPDACSFGVDIFSDVIEHCKQSLNRWQEARQERGDNKSCLVQPSMEFVCGNGLDIDSTLGECQFGFDRIYVGASVQRSYLNKLADLLRPGGILVAPGMLSYLETCKTFSSLSSNFLTLFDSRR